MAPPSQVVSYVKDFQKSCEKFMGSAGVWMIGQSVVCMPLQYLIIRWNKKKRLAQSQHIAASDYWTWGLAAYKTL